MTRFTKFIDGAQFIFNVLCGDIAENTNDFPGKDLDISFVICGFWLDQRCREAVVILDRL